VAEPAPFTGRDRDEWIGRHPDSAIPARVKVRIYDRQGGRCDGCGRKFDAKLTPEYDHRPALINGGQNRESMIFAVCQVCHPERTRADVAEKSDTYGMRLKHILPKKSKGWGKGFTRTKNLEDL
jgi:5-methylcytosine-specific restriction endonuclease McrA